MISFVMGVVDSIGEDGAVIEQNGVGYGITMSASALQRLEKGKEVKILTHMQVKEDGITLFGFITSEEKAIFRRLISVTGVGPRGAMSLLSVLTPAQIMLAVITDDINALSHAPGIGKKTAGRIALELKDKIKASDDAAYLAADPQLSVAGTGGPKQDAVDALTALGYGRSEAVRAVMEVYVPELDVEQTIKLALKKLAG